MYKAGHTAVSRTILPSIHQKQRTGQQSNANYVYVWRTPEEKQLLTTANKDEPLFPSDMPISMFSRKKRRQCPSLTPPSTPSSPLVEQQIEFLHNSWKAFRETPSGEVDTRIVTYTPEKKDCNQSFEPFNIDRFLAEKLLKELDIDPKLALY